MTQHEADLAVRVLEEAYRAGVRDFCICPGARNYELISLILNEKKLTHYFHIDERTAAFFALGIIKKHHRPVAIVTTSGTAAGELLPATMEAYYTGLPLLLITADRPRSYRRSGAPQAAEQADIYGQYAPFILDLEGKEQVSLSGWNQHYPAHLNVCLEEPKGNEQATLQLEEGVLKKMTYSPPMSYEGWNINKERIHLKDEGHRALDQFFDQVKHPLIVVSTLKSKDREEVVKFLLSIQAPVFLESPSGIREDKRLAHLRVNRTVQLWDHASKSDYPIDGVLRIGGVPTFRLWRDIEARKDKVHLFSVNDAPFTGISWGTMAYASLDDFFRDFTIYKTFNFAASSKWLSLEQKYANQLIELTGEFPFAQCSLAHKLSKIIPEHSQVFLGNSLSIRDWDLAATWESRGVSIHATRGLNGIDGQVATFLGMLDSQVENWAVLGDLTTLYDIGSFWILPQLQPYDYTFRLVVINNYGGKIFADKFLNPMFQNPHQISFENLAKFWGLDYQRWTDIPEAFSNPSKKLLIEINPHEEETLSFAKKLSKL